MGGVAGAMVGSALAAAALSGTLMTVLPPLRVCLAQLCGDRRRGDVWTMLFAVCSTLGVIASALVSVDGGDAESPSAAARVLHGGLAALLGSSAVAAVMVLRTPAGPPSVAVDLDATQLGSS